MRARNFPGRLLLGLSLSVIAASAMLFLSAIAANNETARIGPLEILPQFQEVYEQATEQVDLPVLLPTHFPGMGTEFWLSEYVAKDGNLYTLSVDVQPGCGGAGACSRGSLGGEIVAAETEPVEEIYAFLNEPSNDPNRPRSDDSMGIVELMSGIEGIFIPWVATAQCSEAKVYWEQPSASGDETYRYYVGIECGNLAEVVELADNVIANTEGF